MKDWIIFLSIFALLFYIYYTRYRTKVIDLEDLVEDVGYTQLYSEKSKFQGVDVIRLNPNDHGYNKCLVLNNEIQLCDNDEAYYHEMIVHFPAYYIPHMEHVLIIGGGDLMTLREVMKYKSIKTAVVLELDKKVVDVCKQFFNVDTYEHDPRVKIVYGDAAENIKQTPDRLYDLVIIDSTEDGDINSPLEERTFFELCKTKMNPGGILIKNGFITSQMPPRSRKHKMNMLTDLKRTFRHAGVYSANIYTYGDSDYSFIMASDAHRLRDPRKNVETREIVNEFKKYRPSQQKNYISRQYNA